MSQKESEWKEVVDDFRCGVQDAPDTDEYIRENLPILINELLSNKENEIAGEVKKIKTAGHDECNYDFLMNVLKILKHK